jgi:hypothetical protein
LKDLTKYSISLGDTLLSCMLHQALSPGFCQGFL